MRLRRRGRAEPLYGHAIDERFGAYTQAPSTGRVWVHAVSLGETRAAAALIDALRVVRPGMKLLLTNGTATGREAGAALLREGDVQVWQPYDTPSAVRAFYRRFRPAVGGPGRGRLGAHLFAGRREGRGIADRGERRQR